MKTLSVKTLCLLLVVSMWLLGCKSDKSDGGKGLDSDSSEVTQCVAFDENFFADEDLPTYLCGCHVDIENMSETVDLNMDISKLPLADLRILRNVIAAQQGYCFTDSFLRHVFGATSWYYERAEEIYYKTDAQVDVKYTKEQMEFIERIKAREAELEKQNYNPVEGALVNYKNVTNRYQFTDAGLDFRNMISKNGFVIVEGQDEQLFHVYENNDYNEFPSFVTTDLYMQLFHMYFDYLLRDLEQTRLIDELKSFSLAMNSMMMNLARATTDKRVKAAAEYNATYYAIGASLLSNKVSVEVPSAYREAYNAEIQQVKSAIDDYSSFLEYDNVAFPYSLFRPRGHYTRNDKLKAYFMSMMWFQYVPFCLDDDNQFDRAIVSAEILSGSEELLRKYSDITNPIEFIVGEADNVSILQMAEKMKSSGFSAEKMFGNSAEYEKYRSQIKKLADAQNRIKPKEVKSCVDKINLMPQRYLADNEVLQELVDVMTKPESLRPLPKGLDVLAAFGCDAAKDILMDECKEGEKWPNYVEKFDDIKKTMEKVNWDKSMYNKWMQSLNESVARNDKAPYFMKTRQWDKKNINAALASWSELKHDCILYSEQPFAAECGGGGLPEPILVGYVEPNVAYWTKVIELIEMTESMLRENNSYTKNMERISERMKDLAVFLKKMSEKELAGKKLTEAEYSYIKAIGSTVEWITLDLLNDEGAELYGWYCVTGTDRSVAVVADVYTANADNNPNKSILYEATGCVNSIYVIVEIDGYLYLTRGAVFSYREFPQPLDQPRLTDEEWQKMLKESPRYGVPEWMNEIILPGKDMPSNNNSVFYSSGC